MGEKVTFNEITKVIEIDEAPDVDGDVLINVKSYLYSDGKEDWVANENLRKFYFPIEAEGGKPLPGEKDLGSSFFLASDWKIQPYDANHRLIIDGNLYSVDGSDPFIDTVSNYPVRIMQQVSDLVSTITVTSGSGLSQEEHDQLMALPNSVWEHSDGANVVLDVKRILGLAQENFKMDQQIYDDYNGAKLLTSARIRIYSDNALTQLLATYAVTATWSNNQCTGYQVAKQ